MSRGVGVFIALPLCLALVAAASTGQALAQGKVGIVNLQRAVEESSEGKTMLTGLQNEAARKKKELEKKRDELKKLSDDLSKQEAILKPDVFQKRRQELEQKAMQFQETVMRSEQEFQIRQQKVLQPIQQKAVTAVATIAARDKLTLVVRTEAVVWPQQSELDITNEVIRKLNSK